MFLSLLLEKYTQYLLLSFRVYYLNFAIINTGLSSSFNVDAIFFNSPVNCPFSFNFINVCAG